MKEPHDPRLESAINRLLKELPDRKAPRDLASAVLSRVHGLEAQQGWSSWSLNCRVLVLGTLALVFGLICWVGGGVPSASLSTELQKFSEPLRAFMGILGTLVGSLTAVLKHMGHGFLWACVLALVLGYAVCVAIGSAFLKLALARH